MSTNSALLVVFILMVVVPNSLLGMEHDNPGGNVNPHVSKAVQANVQARRSVLFGCNGLDFGDVNITCIHERLESRHGLGMNCAERVPLKTRAEFLSCPPGFNVGQEYTTITCTFPGNWDNDVFTCEETPTLEPTTTKPTTTTKNSTAAKNLTTTKPTTKKPANVTTIATVRNTNNSTGNSTATSITVVTGNSTTNTTTATTVTNPVNTTTTVANTTTTTPLAIQTTTPVGPVYETVVGVGVVKRGMKCLTYTDAAAECLREGAVVMSIDTPARLAYVKDYMAIASIYVGASNTYDFWVGISGGIGNWKTSKGVAITNILGFKWLPTRPINGTSCAVWSKTSEGHWDVPTADCVTRKLPYICEKL